MKEHTIARAELVEQRRLLSVALAVNGDLKMVGTSQADTFVVTTTASQISITERRPGMASPLAYSFARPLVKRIVAELREGNDSFTMPSSFAIPASVTGGAGNDTIVTGAGKDSVFGQSGADTIVGNDGDDQLNAGYAGVDPAIPTTGIDTIDGGNGADNIAAADANALMAFGRAGSDQLVGSTANDFLSGGGAPDTILGGAGNDTLLPGGGDGAAFDSAGVDELSFADVLTGVTVSAFTEGLFYRGVIGAGQFQAGAFEVLRGSAFADSVLDPGALTATARIYLGAGNDSLRAGTRGVTVMGEAGSDTLLGGAGNDCLVGGLGDDLLSGIGSDDTLMPGGQGDTVYAGAGVDVLDFSDAPNGIVIESDPSASYNNPGRLRSAVAGGEIGFIESRSIEDVRLTNFADRMIAPNLFEGSIRMDLRGGNDFVDLSVRAGDASVYPQPMPATALQMDCGAGNDAVNTGSIGAATVYGGDGNDTLFSPGWACEVYGGAGTNALRAWVMYPGSFADRCENPGVYGTSTVDFGQLPAGVKVRTGSFQRMDGTGPVGVLGDLVGTFRGTRFADDISAVVNWDSTYNEQYCFWRIGQSAVTMEGREGDDTLTAPDGGGSWVLDGRSSSGIDGGPGNDTITTFTATAYVNGGAGDDVIVVTGRAVTQPSSYIHGDSGNDSIELIGQFLYLTVIDGAGDDVVTLRNPWRAGDSFAFYFEDGLDRFRSTPFSGPAPWTAEQAPEIVETLA